VINVDIKAKGTYEVEVWKFRVVNPDLVPREYLIIDDKTK